METGSIARWGVIMDLDGTMVKNNAYHRQAWFDLCARYGMRLTDQDYYGKIHARGNDKIVPNLFGPDVDPAFAEQIQNEKERLYQEGFSKVIAEAPGLTALLTAFVQADIPCALASNSPTINVDFVLDRLNLRRFFSAIFSRDDVALGKPDPEILFKAAQALGLPPGRCLVFEDSSSGFAAARAAQMPFIAITGGADPTESAHAADAVAAYPDFTGITVPRLAALMYGCLAH